MHKEKQSACGAPPYETSNKLEKSANTDVNYCKWEMVGNETEGTQRREQLGMIFSRANNPWNSYFSRAGIVSFFDQHCPA